ncbi:MAG TPA: hypothetical protein VGQ22_07070 [Steroidobacteraceae bacterium]|jgi:hypothetical protein|nr:hypothetical protein [Steroidobacteraceae bacterium]
MQSATRESRSAEWSPSIYYAHSVIHRALQDAWPLLLRYEAWNPGFAHARVTRLRGEARSEGELVLIQAMDEHGQPLPGICAETVRIVSPRHIAWFVYPADGCSFQNFLDFTLTEVSGAVRFDISWYSLDRLSGDALLKHRKETEAGAFSLTAAFRNYCETTLR